MKNESQKMKLPNPQLLEDAASLAAGLIDGVTYTQARHEVDTRIPKATEESVTAEALAALKALTNLEKIAYAAKSELIDELMKRTNNNKIAKASEMHPTSIKSRRDAVEKRAQNEN